MTTTSGTSHQTQHRSLRSDVKLHINDKKRSTAARLRRSRGGAGDGFESTGPRAAPHRVPSTWEANFSLRGTSMKKRQFILVVVDRDTGEFTVEGPMSDDRLWNSAVVNAQRVGRNIRCFSMGNIAPDVAATEWHLSYGGRRIGSGSIVWASHHVVH